MVIRSASDDENPGEIGFSFFNIIGALFFFCLIFLLQKVRNYGVNIKRIELVGYTIYVQKLMLSH